MSERILEEAIGIDLGTTNSCVSRVKIKSDGTYEIEVLENSGGSRTTPSVTYYKKDGGVLVGESAKRNALTDPENTIISNKANMGKEGFKYNIRGKSITPEEVSATVLSKMKEIAEAKLGGKIKKAVITVPAYFDDAQRKATLNAATIAGLDPLRIINEPTAAALAYGLDKKINKEEENILVYDLGGGTFDVSILKISADGVFEVVSTKGIGDLGGDDYNKRIVDIIVDKFEKKEGINLIKRDDKVVLQRIYEAAEKAKHALSNELQVEINEPFIIASKENKLLNLHLTITRQEFEEKTKDLTEKTIVKIKEALEDAKTKNNGNKVDVDQIILVGGSSRIPKVRYSIKKQFDGKEPSMSVNPDEAVSIGAAIQGAILTGGFKNRDILLLDITRLSLGIEAEGGAYVKLIERNTTIPAKKEQIFSTAADGQTTVDICVFQGERAKARDNKLIGNFQLSGIKPAPRGIPQIKIIFDIDANGVVRVSAKDVTDPNNEREQSIEIETKKGLSKEDIERMLKEAEENKKADEEMRQNFAKLNEAQTYLHTFKQQLEDLKKQKDFKEEDPQFQEFQKMYESLKKSVDEKNYSEVRSQLTKIEEFQKILSELKQKMPEKSQQQNDDAVVEDVKTEGKNKKDKK